MNASESVSLQLAEVRLEMAFRELLQVIDHLETPSAKEKAREADVRLIPSKSRYQIVRVNGISIRDDVAPAEAE